MSAILCYTRCGEGVYTDEHYPGHVAYLCDLEHALHLAISDDGTAFLQNAPSARAIPRGRPKR